ncbi:MAG: hypothetical protein HY645_06560 [Acidobacteria bacterium]|nr:hypothetical protein [Acidobacteriota bacterium]
MLRLEQPIEMHQRFFLGVTSFLILSLGAAAVSSPYCYVACVRSSNHSTHQSHPSNQSPGLLCVKASIADLHAASVECVLACVRDLDSLPPPEPMLLDATLLPSVLHPRMEYSPPLAAVMPRSHPDPVPYLPFTSLRI